MTILPIIRRLSRQRSPVFGAKVGAARILAVLEPRSNTMKLGVMKDQLPASLPKSTSPSATVPISAGMRLPRWRRWGPGVCRG